MFKRPCVLLAVGLTVVFMVYGLSKDWFAFTIQTGFDTVITLLFLPQMIVAGSFARFVNFSQFLISVSDSVKITGITALVFSASLLHAWIIVSIWNKFHRKKIIISTAPILMTIILAFITGMIFTIDILIRAKEQARRNACFQNVRTLMHMCYMYADDYGGHFPPSLEALNMAGYEIGNLTICPTAKGNADYGLNTAAALDSVSDAFPHYMPLIGDFDSNNHGCGGWIYYVDFGMLWQRGSYSAGSGPLENVSPQDWVRE